MPYFQQTEATSIFNNYLNLKKSGKIPSSKSPLCALQASPGFGKTRFLVELAQSMFKDGGFYPVMVTFNSEMSLNDQDCEDPLAALVLRMIAKYHT